MEKPRIFMVIVDCNTTFGHDSKFLLEHHKEMTTLSKAINMFIKNKRDFMVEFIPVEEILPHFDFNDRLIFG